jgi:hypothetical protein
MVKKFHATGLTSESESKDEDEQPSKEFTAWKASKLLKHLEKFVLKKSQMNKIIKLERDVEEKKKF